MLVHEGVQLGQHLGVAAAAQLRVEAPLAHEQPQLVEPRRGGARDAVRREVGERRPAPEPERVLQQLAGALGLAALERLAPLRGHPLEAVQVDGVVRGAQTVAWLPRLDQVAAELLAQRGHVPLHDVERRRRWLVAPDLVDQPHRGHEVAGAQDEQRQDSALVRPAEPHAALVHQRLDRAEHSVLDGHGATVPRWSERHATAALKRASSG